MTASTDHRTRQGCTTVDGMLLCRATGKRVLSHRQAVQLARKAVRRDGRRAEAYHCASCAGWHYGHTTPDPIRRRQPQPRWRRQHLRIIDLR